MAPPTGSAKPRKTGGAGTKPIRSSRPVVPAIPLPFVKRRAAADAAAAAAAAAAATATLACTNAASASDTPTVAVETQPAALRTETKPSDGTALENDEAEMPAASAVPEASHLPSEKPSEALDEVRPDSQNSPSTYQQHSKQINAPLTQSASLVGVSTSTPASASSAEQQPSTVDEPDKAVNPAVTSEPSDRPTTEPQVPAHSHIPAPEPTLNKSDETNGFVSKDEVKHRPAQQQPHVNNPKHRQAPPTMSPNRYQMPPSFRPANGPVGFHVHGNMPRTDGPPLPNRPTHIHQQHMSNSSVHFGAFNGSTSSSPAPPLSGSTALPPGMPPPDGPPPYMGHTVNGFPPPPMVPYGNEMIGTSKHEPYARPSMGYGPVESYPPYGNNFGRPTSHHYHDSQASVQAEGNAMYHQYPAGLPRNGVTGHADDLQSPYHQGGMYGGHDPRMLPKPAHPPHLMSPIDDADGLVEYLQQQWGVQNFEDCVLELRYVDDRAPPVRLPGHRLIFMRSPTLAQVMQKQASHSSPSAADQMQQILLLEINNKWIHSAAFYIAVQRLYGHPLLSMPPIPNGSTQGNVADPNLISERFFFALSYAAAGRVLGWNSVVQRGCELAAKLLNWHNLDAALEFALEYAPDRDAYNSYNVQKYGDGCQVLLSEVVIYIINNLPSNFTINTSLANPDEYGRLPSYPSSSASTSTSTEEAAIAHEAPVHINGNRRAQQITGIQFGDLSLAETNSAVKTPKASLQAYPPFHDVLTRILLNLPFSYLKMALESAGPTDMNGWTDAENRFRIIQEAVAERERRRLKAVDAVKAGLVANWEATLNALSSPHPRTDDKESLLGWKEELLAYGRAEGPSLVRKWVPLMISPSNIAAYP